MNNIQNIIKNNIPLIDLRAPVEFLKGSIPQSVNLPILNDEERAQVGTTFKYQGQDEAIKLGYKLVEKEKDKRILLWKSFIHKNPNTQLYCMRGGKRSQIAQSWLLDEGISVPAIKGGFKALRNTAIKILNSVENDNKEWLVLGGRTGSGKTQILNEFKSSIDLEYHARHRGSAFGNFDENQPTAINFENILASQYIQHDKDIVFLEDESRRIGKLGLPIQWHKKMQLSKIVIIDIPLDQRVENIFEEYVHRPINDGISKSELSNSLQQSLFNIRKRLGPILYSQIKKEIDDSFKGNHLKMCEEWISSLLINYYDPMYDYQLIKKMDRCILKDTKLNVISFLNQIENNQRLPKGNTE